MNFNLTGYFCCCLSLAPNHTVETIIRQTLGFSLQTSITQQHCFSNDTKNHCYFQVLIVLYFRYETYHVAKISFEIVTIYTTWHRVHTIYLMNAFKNKLLNVNS